MLVLNLITQALITWIIIIIMPSLLKLIIIEGASLDRIAYRWIISKQNEINKFRSTLK